MNKRAFFGAFLIFWGFKFLSMNCRYEKASIILTSNKGVADWGEMFGDHVLATAILNSCA
ncbi:IS21 ORF2 (plasmid) [Shigella sonnei Ss046]|uniref:IS21 ORF2 n=2 Tax=Shigella sonnei TaxID=624 RepID=Q3YTX9_SHISS|nr:IS21 ORF2 [Shigella sonnei Ss046]